MVTVSSCQKLPPLPDRDNVSWFQDSQAEPIRDRTSTSGRMLLKKGEKNPLQWQPERRGGISETNSPAGTKAGAEGWAGGALCAGAEIPLQTL